MSEMIKEFNKGDLLHIDKDGKAQWGFPDGYPYKEDNRTIIEWDGNINGKEIFSFGNISNPFKFYKVSDVTVSAGDLLGAASSVYIASIDRSVNIKVTSDLILDYSEYGSIMIMSPENNKEPIVVVILDSDKMAASGINISEGIYFFSDSSSFIDMLTYGSEIIHTMAPESLPYATTTTPGIVKQMPYLPNATGDASTAENFNQLLRQLKNAGLMK